MYITRVADIRFEWDPVKARANARRNGISFEEAETAFHDDFALLVFDPDHSEDESRFLLIGLGPCRTRLERHPRHFGPASNPL